MSSNSRTVYLAEYAYEGSTNVEEPVPEISVMISSGGGSACLWTADWSSWSGCTVTCGSGIQSREKPCECAISECDGVQPVETQACATDICVEQTEDPYVSSSCDCSSNMESSQSSTTSCNCGSDVDPDVDPDYNENSENSENSSIPTEDCEVNGNCAEKPEVPEPDYQLTPCTNCSPDTTTPTKINTTAVWETIVICDTTEVTATESVESTEPMETYDECDCVCPDCPDNCDCDTSTTNYILEETTILDCVDETTASMDVTNSPIVETTPMPVTTACDCSKPDCPPSCNCTPEIENPETSDCNCDGADDNEDCSCDDKTVNPELPEELESTSIPIIDCSNPECKELPECNPDTETGETTTPEIPFVDATQPLKDENNEGVFTTAVPEKTDCDDTDCVNSDCNKDVDSDIENESELETEYPYEESSINDNSYSDTDCEKSEDDEPTTTTVSPDVECDCTNPECPEKCGCDNASESNPTESTEPIEQTTELNSESPECDCSNPECPEKCNCENAEPVIPTPERTTEMAELDSESPECDCSNPECPEKCNCDNVNPTEPTPQQTTVKVNPTELNEPHCDCSMPECPKECDCENDGSPNLESPQENTDTTDETVTTRRFLGPYVDSKINSGTTDEPSIHPGSPTESSQPIQEGSGCDCNNNDCPDLCNDDSEPDCLLDWSQWTECSCEPTENFRSRSRDRICNDENIDTDLYEQEPCSKKLCPTISSPILITTPTVTREVGPFPVTRLLTLNGQLFFSNTFRLTLILQSLLQLHRVNHRAHVRLKIPIAWNLH